MPCAGRSPTARAIRIEANMATDGRQDRAPHSTPRSLPVARTSPPPSTLRLYTEPAARAAKSAARRVASLPDVLQAFQRATGWTLQYAVRTGAQDFQREIDGRTELVRSGQPGSWNRSRASHARAVRCDGEAESRQPQVALRGGAGIGIGHRRHAGRDPATSPRPGRARGRTCRGRALGAAPRRTRTPGQPARSRLARRGPGRRLPCGSLVPSRRGNQQAEVTVLLGTAFGSAHGARLDPCRAPWPIWNQCWGTRSCWKTCR